MNSVLWRPFMHTGNNDREWAEGLAKTLRFTIEGVEFFMTHNKKDVDWELWEAPR